MSAERDPAERRLWLLTLLRLAGLAVILAGLWLAAGSGGAATRLVAGLLLAALGATLSLLVPRALARRWRQDRRP
ncbi:MAG: hypothetical protein ACK4Z0_02535 [Sphingomonadaceae bacterium]